LRQRLSAAGSEWESEMKHRRIEVNDLMQQGYVYILTEPAGRNFPPDFHPELTPKEMLELGIFGGKYMTDCVAEYPSDWFKTAKLCHQRHNPDFELLWDERFPAALLLAREGLDLSRRPARLVPVVLPLLPWKAVRRRPTPDQTVASFPKACRAGEKELPPS
jgi:hypothetical protein